MSSLSVKDSQEPGSSADGDLKRPKHAKQKNHYKSCKKKRINSGRKCKICGKDPHPNYFFCPACHHRIEAYEECDEK